MSDSPADVSIRPKINWFQNEPLTRSGVNRNYNGDMGRTEGLNMDGLRRQGVPIDGQSHWCEGWTTGGHAAVSFVPYTGISPRRFYEIFSWVDRKLDDVLERSGQTLDGAMREWNAATADVRESIALMGSINHRTRLDATRFHELSLFRDYEVDRGKAVGRVSGVTGIGV